MRADKLLKLLVRPLVDSRFLISDHLIKRVLSRIENKTDEERKRKQKEEPGVHTERDSNTHL